MKSKRGCVISLWHALLFFFMFFALEAFLLRRLLTDLRGGDLFGRCRYPLRLQKVPQISQIYTDFSWDVFLVTQISQMTQIFFIIGRHGISRRRPVRSLQISPWDWTKRFIRDSIKNLWKSVKSVGQKNNEKENQDDYFFLVFKRI